MENLIGKKEIMDIFKCSDRKALVILRSEQVNGFKIGKFWYCQEKDIKSLIEVAKHNGVDLVY